MPLTHQITAHGAEIPDLETLNRYVLGLPLEDGISRADVRALITRDATAAQLVAEMRIESKDLLDLATGWGGYKGAILAARGSGMVSQDVRLQRAWKFYLSQSPQAQQRIERAAVWFGRDTKVQPAPQNHALSTTEAFGLWLGRRPAMSGAITFTCCAFFVVIGRVTAPTIVPTDPYPGDGIKGTRFGATSSSNGHPGPGPRGWATANENLQKLLNPVDHTLPQVIVWWENAARRNANDSAIRLKLHDLYGRALKLKPATLGLEASDVTAYKASQAGHARWLAQRGLLPTSGAR